MDSHKKIGFTMVLASHTYHFSYPYHSITLSMHTCRVSLLLGMKETRDSSQCATIVGAKKSGFLRGFCIPF